MDQHWSAEPLGTATRVIEIQEHGVSCHTVRSHIEIRETNR
jgi:hypothetical protein